MSRSLARHHSTLVYDISPKRAKEFASQSNAEPLHDLANIPAEVKTVILMLPTSQHVEDTLLTMGLLDHLAPGSLIIDMGSSIPESTRVLEAKANQQHISYVDAPVSGGVAKAETAELTILVGGEPTAVALARPYLETIGSTILTVGKSGTGHAAKAINNLVSASNIAVATEAVLRAKAAGISPERMVEVLNSSTGMSQASRVKLVDHILTGKYSSNFAYDLMIKDMSIALGIKLPESSSPMTTTAFRFLSEGRRHLGDNPDHTEIARVYEKISSSSISDQ